MKSESKLQIAIAVIFASLMLVTSLTMGEHENSSVMLFSLIGGYIATANMYRVNKKKC